MLLLAGKSYQHYSTWVRQDLCRIRPVKLRHILDSGVDVDKVFDWLQSRHSASTLELFTCEAFWHSRFYTAIQDVDLDVHYLTTASILGLIDW
jgi:hypothetical protein